MDASLVSRTLTPLRGPDPCGQACVGKAARTLDYGILKFRSLQAQARWSESTRSIIKERLDQFRKNIVNRAGELANAVAAHRNCTTSEALATEILPLADAARYLTRNFSSVLAPKRLSKKDRPGWLTGVDCEVHRQPFGLVLIIAPGNYPLFLAAVQAIQALAAGNAVWIKPAPGASNILNSLREELVAAGFDPDLVQILSESVEAAQAAIEAGVDKLVFTGSADTGRQILSRLAPHLTPATMELSGCDAVFIRPDADVALTARAIRFGLGLNQGRTCIAPRRIFVARQLLGKFTRQLREELQTIETIPLDHDSARKWLPWVKEALADGAFIVSGTLHEDRIDGPMVLSGTKPEMRLLQEDAFAPIASIIAVDGDTEALTADEQCPFALSASVFGGNVSAAQQFAKRIRAGSVIVNDLVAPTADPRIPFGGVGQSGFGVTRGAEGLLDMTAPKVVITNKARHRMHHRIFRESDRELFETLLTLSHGSSFIQRMKSLFKAISIFRKPNTSTRTT